MGDRNADVDMEEDSSDEDFHPGTNDSSLNVNVEGQRYRRRRSVASLQNLVAESDSDMEDTNDDAGRSRSKRSKRKSRKPVKKRASVRFRAKKGRAPIIREKLSEFWFGKDFYAEEDLQEALSDCTDRVSVLFPGEVDFESHSIGSIGLHLLFSHQETCNFINRETIVDSFLKTQHKFFLHVSEIPTRSVLEMHWTELLKEEVSADSSGFRQVRERFYNRYHWYTHFTKTESFPPQQIFGKQGLGSKSFFLVCPYDFSADSVLEIDVRVREEYIQFEANLDEPPVLNRGPLRLLNYFFGMQEVVIPFEANDTKDDIEWLYHQVKKYHKLFPISINVEQPSSLRITLRPYQLAGLNWMSFRENFFRESSVANEEFASKPQNMIISKILDFIFIRKHLNSNEAEKTVHYNQITGELFWTKPRAPALPLGGLLCDSMGLGKTIEVLSLILKNKAQDCEAFILEKEGEQNFNKPNSTLSSGLAQTLVHPRHRKKRCISPCEFQTDLKDEEPNFSESISDDRAEDQVGSEILSMSQAEVLEAIPGVSEGPLPKAIRLSDSMDTLMKVEIEQDAEYPDAARGVVEDTEKHENRKAVAVTKSDQKGSKGEGSLYSKIKVLYDVALSSYASAKHAEVSPTYHGTFYDVIVPRKHFFECPCDEGNRDRTKTVVTCTECSSSHHASCVGYDISLLSKVSRNYLCPHCLLQKEPVPIKATLIVTPVAISHQWLQEIRKHIRNEDLKILFYKGVSQHGYIPPLKLATYDLVVTTYAVMSSEINFVDLPHANKDEARRFRQPKRFMVLPSPLPCVKWWRLCLDEAQMVEGYETKVSRMTCRLQASNRWCITGTPMNKGLEDLFGLYTFLDYPILKYKLYWEEIVLNQFRKKNKELITDIFGEFMWRTSKYDVLDELGIPPQTEIIHPLKFSPVEVHFYRKQFEECSEKIISRMNKLLNNSNYTPSTLLSSVAPADLRNVLVPFLELRQACCHPQMAKGQLISIPKKGALSMEDLLNELIKKAIVQCADDHRLIIAAMNGIAGVYWLQKEYYEASETYREVLHQATKYEAYFKTDSLQLLHAYENLADLIDEHHFDVPHTLVDDKLREKSASLKKAYIEGYIKNLESVESIVQKYSSDVNAVQCSPSLCKNETWWMLTFVKAARNAKLTELICKIKENLTDNTKLKNKSSMAEKFHDPTGLHQLLIENLQRLDSSRITVLDSVKNLKQQDPSSWLQSAINCHLRTTKGSKQEQKCALCSCDDQFLSYEALLFSSGMITSKIKRTGRRWQQMKLMGEISSELTEEEMNLVLLKEEEELIESTDHVNLKHRLEGAKSHADSDTERALKFILNFARTNDLPHEVLADASRQLKVLAIMKKEYYMLRVLLKKMYDQISALDELSLATTRLRLQNEWEKVAAQNTKKAIDGLALSQFYREQKLSTLNVLSEYELQPKLAEMNGEKNESEANLKIHMGQLLYLENLKKNGYGKTGSYNTDTCPICENQLGTLWSVLICGHSFCNNCTKTMGKQNDVSSFLCPLCRTSMKYFDVSFVDASGDDEQHPTAKVSATDGSGKRIDLENLNSDSEKIEVLGSHSTKIEGIIKTLLKLQRSHPGEKVLLFSTWKSVLDLISIGLDQNSITYCSLNKAGKAFQIILNKFKTREDIQVLLIPISSGSKGLNIVEATHVILTEPVLNTANALQAIGRVHRIGQTKPTCVHRFYVKNTIEEKLFTMLQHHDVSSSEEGCLTLEDLKNLAS